MNTYLDRIARLNTDLRFFEDLAASGPIDAAAPVRDGPLAGHVVGIKANIRVAGQGWTAGIGARAGLLAEADAPVVGLLRAAGATILGRLMMDEGALGAATDNPHFGRCENPAWPGHTAGGSSGGSAAAVAAGAVDAALGSDTMGSVRIPAAYCGVYGLKLGAGAVSMQGVFPLAPSLDALGILARQPQVLRQVWDVLQAHASDPVVPTGWLRAASSVTKRCAPEMQAFYQTCCAALADLLGDADCMPPLDPAALRADAFLLTEVEAVSSLGSEPGLSPGVARLVDYGRGIDGQKHRQIRARLDAAGQTLRDAMGNDRVMLLPTVAEPAFLHGARPPADQADFTALANIAGCPAIAIPRRGAVPPVSVQIIGPQGTEGALVTLAQAVDFLV